VAQIFISHSSKDIKPIDLVSKVFASTNVQAKYEEIEAIMHGRRTAAQIAADVMASNAVFVVLGRNAESLSHTRDWVVSESGIARGMNKDIWVLEAFEESPSLSVIIPHLRHYVCFHYNDAWLGYLRAIVTSYDDAHVFKAFVAGAGVGAAVSESPVGALIGGGIAWILAANATAQARPAGIPLNCGNCHSSYSVHVEVSTSMRCPVCNSRIGLPFQR
jgi:hypothetical protein